MDQTLVAAMTRTLHHRGPDDSGVCTFAVAGLGHSRLSILDLSAAGHQPMQTEDQRFTLVYNGETYNFLDLRRRLEALGVRFRSRSDTEVVLQAFVRWGPDSFAMLNGMFALALWDDSSQTLHLARDRFGIKPLYYCVSNSAFVFGSEIKALLASGHLHRQVEGQALQEYLYYGNALGRHTLFRGVHRLLPGHYLRFDANGLVTSAYWSLEDVRPVSDGVRTATETVRGLFADAVQTHLVSDVPVGIFLSGGIDSSAITCVASDRYHRRLQTFSVGFDFDQNASELPKARAVAEHFRTDHHEIHIAGADMPSVIERLVRCHDEPFGDAANIPLYLLCEQIKGSIKVVLQGDGGDEMFGGYRRYNLISFERFWRRVAAAALPVTRLAPRTPAYHRARRFFRAILETDAGMQAALLLTSESLDMLPTRVLSADVRSSLAQLDPFNRYREIGTRLGQLDAVQRLLYTDTSILLPDTFLEKVDRATMAHGIEVRVPFLDMNLSAYAMGLPSRMKLRRGQKKWIFRRAMRGLVPDAILNAPKHGFSVPLNHWIRGPLAEYVRSVLLDQSTLKSGLFDRGALEAVIHQHATGRKNDGVLLYKLLNLALWHYAYLGSGARATASGPLANRA